MQSNLVKLASVFLQTSLLVACAQVVTTPASPRLAAPPASRVLSARELMDYPAWRAVRDVQFIGDPFLVGTYEGQRFVVEYFCTYYCPGFVDAVYHFIDLKTPEACEAIGAEMRGIEIQVDFGRQTRNFCVASKRMLVTDNR
jgi:hypothetical protein